MGGRRGGEGRKGNGVDFGRGCVWRGGEVYGIR